MVMDPNLSKLLSADLEQVKEKPLLPGGTYYSTIKSYEFIKSKDKGTPGVRFHFAPPSPSDDVAEECSTLGLDMSKYDRFKADFYITEDSLIMIKNFLVTLGLSVTGKGVGECLPETTGCAVKLDITQEPSRDGKRMFNNVREVSGVTE